MKDREAYRRKFEAQLKEWRAEIDRLSARTEKARADANLEVNRRVETLRKKYDQVRERYDELRSAGDQAFDRMRTALESAVEELQSAWDEIKSDERLEKTGSKRD